LISYSSEKYLSAKIKKGADTTISPFKINKQIPDESLLRVQAILKTEKNERQKRFPSQK
jgi:hypothetical protein